MIFVFSEDNETAFEILSEANKLADSSKSKIAAISFGGTEDDYIACGADIVFSINIEPHEDSVVEGISVLIDQYKPETLLIGSTKFGREVAPGIGQRFGAGCATDCIDFSKDNENLTVKRLVLGGRFITTQRFLRKPQIATVPPGRFEKNINKSRKGEIIKISFKPAKTRVQVMETKKKVPQEMKIEEANIIVSAGRGLKKKEDLKLIEALANVLGGAMGCSRSIAADLKWLPEEHWIGLSGHKVNPRLYIAIGISGQVQHIAGIRDARTIIAINKDPNAPIFKSCDYGIVGDLYDIVPRLTEILKKKS
ncbi:MAG: electron transfer flavoprotein subunit alpha/FixB family protein [Candidatus Methanoperedens sp.]|nr:electron transfer flavoprotein subunit alpha/FixB family protein [Candidatus Methanoperedens sp.]MCE8428394.1 electron transfer flavoprotein subunit alpha/FixB family protein [Candidatus Methanoperedens sp.]